MRTLLFALLISMLFLIPAKVGAQSVAPPDYVGGWGSFGTGPGEFNRPGDVALSADGQYVYIADVYNQRIQRFDPDGNFQLEWGYDFLYPRGIAVDNDGYVYVADSERNRIVKFDADGNYIDLWCWLEEGDYGWATYSPPYCGSTPGFDPNHGSLETVLGITVNNSFLFAIGDPNLDDGGVTRKFTLDGNGAGTIGEFYYFNVPHAITLYDSASYVGYWSFGIHRYGWFFDEVFEYDNLVLPYSSYQAEFEADDYGNFYIPKPDDHQVVVVDEQNLLTAWGELGSGTGQFNGPSGIDVDDFGNVYVADEMNHRIQKFRFGTVPIHFTNALPNPSFEEGKSPWIFFTNGKGSFQTVSPGFDHEQYPSPPVQGWTADHMAKVHIAKQGSNVQLYQRDLILEPHTPYRLSFWARSSNGQDMKLFVHKHTAPYTSYGLAAERVDLTTEWQEFTIDFTTDRFDTVVNDGRLRFWFAPFDRNNMDYFIDGVKLEKIDGGTQARVTADSVEVIETGAQNLCLPPPADNLLSDSDFETDDGWYFYTKGKGEFTRTTSAFGCGLAARIEIEKEGKTAQLYQEFSGLEPNTAYSLRFAGASDSGSDVMVFVQKHDKDYETLGLNGAVVDLTDQGKSFEVRFTTTDFDPATGPARVRFDLGPFDQAGDVAWFDNITLAKMIGPAEAPNPSDELLIAGYFIDASEKEHKDGEKVGKPKNSTRVDIDDFDDLSELYFMPLINK